MIDRSGSVVARFAPTVAPAVPATNVRRETFLFTIRYLRGTQSPIYLSLCDPVFADRRLNPCIYARSQPRRVWGGHPSISRHQPGRFERITIWLRDGTRSIRIEPGEIVWISSAGNYVEYSLADGTNHLVRGTLAAAETQLSRFNLARIHRTRLVNLDRVTGMEMKPSGDFELTFDTGQTVVGSRRYKTAVAALDRSAVST